MDDIEAIIEASKHFKYHEPTGTTPFNRISSLPETKRHLKLAIQERMRLLAAAYLSLATFIPDEDVDALEEGLDRKRARRIFERVLRDMEALRAEIGAFDPLELSTAGLDAKGARRHSL